MSDNLAKENGMKEIWCKYIHRNGKIIYPKNADCFHFFVKA